MSMPLCILLRLDARGGYHSARISSRGYSSVSRVARSFSCFSRNEISLMSQRRSVPQRFVQLSTYNIMLIIVLLDRQVSFSEKFDFQKFRHFRKFGFSEFQKKIPAEEKSFRGLAVLRHRLISTPPHPQCCQKPPRALGRSQGRPEQHRGKQ